MANIAVSDTDTAAAAPLPEVTAQLVERIHSIGDLLRDNAIIADKNRVLPDDSVEALESVGALKISTLSRYGGYEGGARMLLEVARAIANYDPAAAWVTVVSNGSVMLANRFPDEVIDAVFADGPVRMASMFASPQGEAIREGSGYRISGDWPFSSNIMHSHWAIGIVPVKEAADAEPHIGFAMFHRDDYRIKDTWYTIGMRGSGSNTMVVENAWIPADRVVTFEHLMGDAFERDSQQTYGRRLSPHLTMSTTIMAPTLGAAEVALDFVKTKAHTRGVTYTIYTRQTESGAFVQGLGAASMKIDTALLHLRRSADRIDAAAAATMPIPLAERAALRGGIGHSGHCLVDAMDDLVWLHGTSSFAEFSPLGRLWRDVNTGARHASVAAPMSYELHGDGLLGIDYISGKL